MAPSSLSGLVKLHSTMSKLHLDVAKEPRGFIKALQFVLAILAFSTTAGFSTYFTFHTGVQNCTAGAKEVIRQEVVYPFNLNERIVEHELCTSPPLSASFSFQTNVSSDARFFVAVGVVSVLYSLAAFTVYVLLNDAYSTNSVLPSIDFMMHALLTILWFTASSAWASGTSALKQGCDISTFGDQLCRPYQNLNCELKDDDFTGKFSNLHVSLIFGFLNTFVWGSNLWFLYKETPWFQMSTPPSTNTTTTPSTVNA